jgi:hypothetical protein
MDSEDSKTTVPKDRKTTVKIEKDTKTQKQRQCIQNLRQEQHCTYIQIETIVSCTKKGRNKHSKN